MALAYAIKVAFLFFKNAGRIYYEKRLKCKNVTQMQNIKYFTATYMMGEYGCQNFAPKKWKFCARNLQILCTIFLWILRKFCSLFQADFYTLELSVALLY